MFKKTLIIDADKEISKKLKNLEYEDALQVLIKDQSIKVVLTQEYYLHLLAKLEQNENNLPVTPFDVDDFQQQFNEELKRADEAISAHDKVSVEGISEY